MIGKVYFIAKGIYKGRLISITGMTTPNNVTGVILQNSSYDPSVVVGREVGKRIDSLKPLPNVGDMVLYKLYKYGGSTQYFEGIVHALKEYEYYNSYIIINRVSDGRKQYIDHDDYIIIDNKVISLYEGDK